MRAGRISAGVGQIEHALERFARVEKADPELLPAVTQHRHVLHGSGHTITVHDDQVLARQVIPHARRVERDSCFRERAQAMGRDAARLEHSRESSTTCRFCLEIIQDFAHSGHIVDDGDGGGHLREGVRKSISQRGITYFDASRSPLKPFRPLQAEFE
jgi:hypothetical protein